MHDSGKGRVYMALALSVLKAFRFSSLADLAEEVKTQCAKLKMPYDNHQVDRALEFVTATDKWHPPAPQTREAVASEQGRPLTAHESREALRRLDGLDHVIKTMPRAVSKIDIYGPIPREESADYDRY